MTDYLLSFDPGLQNGIVLFSYEADAVPVMEYVTQFGGGAEGMTQWLLDVSYHDWDRTRLNVKDLARVWPKDIICEAFTARNTQGFSYTTASLEALPVIGVLVARGLVNRNDSKRYRAPKFQYLVGGKDLPDRKARQHRFLGDSGYRIDRSTIGRTLPDYNDVRSAAAHGLAYISRERKHKPTTTMINKWVEREQEENSNG